MAAKINLDIDIISVYGSTRNKIQDVFSNFHMDIQLYHNSLGTWAQFLPCFCDCWNYFYCSLARHGLAGLIMEEKINFEKIWVARRCLQGSQSRPTFRVFIIDCDGNNENQHENCMVQSHCSYSRHPFQGLVNCNLLENIFRRYRLQADKSA